MNNFHVLRLRECLRVLYAPDSAQQTLERLLSVIDAAKTRFSSAKLDELFSEQDVILITYGDSLYAENELPLQTLHRFVRHYLADTISAIHILPFYPYSSDDGFSVIDYYAVRPELGGWEDIARLGEVADLMFDAVINHMSAQSNWFHYFLQGQMDFASSFVTALPDADLRMVTRPRTTPLLTPFTRADDELVHVWTTFSADQVDLNYADPLMLVRMIEVLLFYVEKGARFIRLDAIAYLWKEIGSSCIHLPQTHAVIQLMRAILDIVAPSVVLITETNVPHDENISYFGDGSNEAQMVYNFTLPPLLFHTLLSGNATKLVEWINSLATPSARTTFFNFSASHDGIGVRPVEGILTPAELAALISCVERRGGRVSYKNNPDGSRSPYELNITYVDAICDPNTPMTQQVKRFILSQAIMLTLAGVPAVYIHSLLGSRNDREGMEQSGQPRRINRARLPFTKIEAELKNPNGFRAQVFKSYQQLLKVRSSHLAFHPKATQKAVNLHKGSVISIYRTAVDGSEVLLALFNVSSVHQVVDLGRQNLYDIYHQTDISGSQIMLEPYDFRWILLG